MFASDAEGHLHFFDLNNLGSSESALKFMIAPEGRISHISAPSANGLMGLSMQNFGGFAIFDLRSG